MEGGKCPNNDKWLIDIDELLFLLTTWSGWFMPVENWIALTGIHTQFWWDVSIYTQVNSPLPFGVFLANSFQQVDLWSCQMNDSGWDSNSSPMISTLDPGPNSLPSPQGVQSACCYMDIHWWMGGTSKPVKHEWWFNGFEIGDWCGLNDRSTINMQGWLSSTLVKSQ